MSISLPPARPTVTPEPVVPDVIVPIPAPDGLRPHLPVLRGPGVYPAQRDTWLLADVLLRELVEAPVARRRVLELCAGSGSLSLVAAGVPGTDVTAVDLSRRALLSAWTNARRLGRRIRLHRGDLAAPVVGKQFDLVVANPPYVPAPDDDLPTRGVMRAFDGGLDGRTVLDRVCDEAPGVLVPGGCLLMVHSALNGVDTSLRRLAAHGLDADVAARCEHPFGPVFTARAAMLEERGLIAPGQRTEELVVIRARRPEGVARAAA
ncbi:HemK2/MTQ2 family protein methyltransferase [Actinomycetospora termitidis]|uniref:Methyltransferase n=1 Tax=Actinomycetospora termitidis TaxID=3053470 RepID=A0ABT7MHJ8_9PSEU|nr:HemK2/MTQ2 family protein methyltransferase [Actinomycetospora sp. Odt1-22]MDL5160149.1 methyltransferase [Actinomycetospora sp. Odt1-22]